MRFKKDFLKLGIPMSLNGSSWQYIIVFGGVEMILEVKGQELKITSPVISEGALNYATFELKCDKSWKKYNKTVRFSHEDSTEIYDVAEVKAGESYYLPEEILKEGKVEVGVIGVKGGDTVITTTKESFVVKGSIDGGKTPRVRGDVYADYVNTVVAHSKKCKSAEKVILEAKKEILRARAESEAFYIGAKEALAESKEILENVSGALDAIGIAMKDIREREEGLYSLDKALSKNEKVRALAENERDFKERARDEKERERNAFEKERELSEKGRIAGERVRAMSESEREKILRDFHLRLTALEDKEDCYTEKLSFEESATTTEDVVSIRISPKQSTSEKVFTVCINGEDVKLSLKSPLIKKGNLSDSIVLEKEKTYVLRNFHTLTLDGSEEIYEEDGEENLFVIALSEEINAYGIMGNANHFSYGKEGDGERVWVSGSYLFLLSDTFNSKKALSDKLKSLKDSGTPLSVTFPLSTPIEEALPFTYFEKENVTLTANDCFINLNVKKNIISTLTKLINKTELIEKQLNEKEK